MEFASNGKGNLGVTLGAIGTGLAAFANTGILNNFNGKNSNNYVTKDEMTYIQQISSKDSEIALLKAESDSEKKMIEVYNQAHAEIANLRDNTNTSIKELQTEININRREQDLWNANQSVANAQMSAAIATNTNSIASINGVLGQVTKIVIPNGNVCPGWGDVTIKPAT